MSTPDTQPAGNVRKWRTLYPTPQCVSQTEFVIHHLYSLRDEQNCRQVIAELNPSD